MLACAGLVSGEDMQPAALEYSQGDRISGKITRKETAAAVLAALGTDAATNKTFEVTTCCPCSIAAVHAGRALYRDRVYASGNKASSSRHYPRTNTGD